MRKWESSKIFKRLAPNMEILAQMQVHTQTHECEQPTDIQIKDINTCSYQCASRSDGTVTLEILLISNTSRVGFSC